MERLDSFLVNNGYFKSRNKAQYEIKNENVLINNIVIKKPSFLVKDTDIITINEKTLKYVSKGGLKLEKALREFNIDVTNYICIDIGASTGGFTDCLLKNNAQFVYCVDTGSNQLDESLRTNKQIKNIAQTNILETNKNTFDNKNIDLITMDVSFVSIKKIIPYLENITNLDTLFIVLIKPQFEVGKKHINKNGIVTDKSVHLKLLNDIVLFLNDLNYTVLNLTKSPISGGSGNIEYLISFNKKGKSKKFDYNKIINT